MNIDEMEEFLKTGVLPNSDKEEQKENLPRRTHRSESREEAPKEEQATSRRRTASRF